MYAGGYVCAVVASVSNKLLAMRVVAKRSRLVARGCDGCLMS
jgi:hypothetical protein